MRSSLISCLCVTVLSVCCLSGDNSVPTRQVAHRVAPPKAMSRKRIIHAWDGVTMWATILNDNYYPQPNREIPPPAAQFSQRILEEMVDEEAAAHIDTISYCLFTAFWSDVPGSKVTDLFPWRPPGMDAAKIDPLKVLIDRCHHHQMKFIADIRMNDRHGARQGIAKKHPEWIILGSANDFAIAGVREAMLTFIQEVLDGYDVDGIEFDYMRWCHMFKPGHGAKNAELLNKFTRQARKLIHLAGKKRGRRLELGVRVPQSLKECRYLGFDLRTWIKEGLVDYVVPSDFFHSDINMKTDDFVKLVKGTHCKIYPAVHPMISMDGPNEHYRLMTLANYRAAAQNFYGFGADGISPYNYQRGFSRRATAHRSSSSAAYMWPAALGWLGELSDPKRVSQRDRHYLFYSIYKKPRRSPTGFSNDDNIYLDRTKPNRTGTRRFRMAERFSKNQARLRTTMQFKAIGLSPDEKLDIRINGKSVPIDYISRVFDKNGQNVYEGDTLPPFFLYVIDMNWETTGRKQPLVFGDNQLSVRILPATSNTTATSFRFVDMVLGVQADDARGVSNVDLNGYLDDFAVWSRVLSDNELQEIATQGRLGRGIASLRLSNDLRVLYEFEDAANPGANSAPGKRSASQVGPNGARVKAARNRPLIGKGVGDFTADDATLKVARQDVERLMPGKGGAMTVSYWLRATSTTANHTVWAMSNSPIPSPRYSTNQSKAVFATQTITVAKPQTIILGLVKPGTASTARVKTNVLDGNWHHIGVTIEQDAKTTAVVSRIFIDGRPAGKLAIGGTPFAGAANKTVSIEELECYVYVRK